MCARRGIRSFLRLEFRHEVGEVGHCLERDQYVGQLLRRVDLFKFHHLVIHEVANVEISAVDMTVAVVLDRIFGERDG